MGNMNRKVLRLSDFGGVKQRMDGEVIRLIRQGWEIEVLTGTEVVMVRES
jgi:hypothetical protein